MEQGGAGCTGGGIQCARTHRAPAGANLQSLYTYLIFVTCTTCGAGVKIFSLVSKNPELTRKMSILHLFFGITVFQNCGYLYLKTKINFCKLQNSTPHHSTPLQTTPHHSTPHKSALTNEKLNLRCFVAKSVLSRFTHFLVSNFYLEMSAGVKKMTNIRYVSPN